MNETTIEGAGEGADEHPWEHIARHTGEAYLRVSFTRGTRAEIDLLVDLLALRPGDRVLDVGCGPGRHAVELARRGMEVVGVDLAADYLEVARAEAAAAGVRARFERLDARRLEEWSAPEAPFDAVVSLCQGAFGSSPPDPADPGHLGADRSVLRGIAASLRPGGRLALGGFNAYFQIRWLEDTDAFDVDRGLNHEHTEVLDSDRRSTPAELWTTCYTPRELRLLVESVGLRPEAVFGVGPGDYSRRPPDLDHPEFLLVAVAPAPPRG